MTARHRFNKNAFTLIELLVVIVIVSILSAGLISVVNPAKQFAKARDTQRKSNLAIITSALEQYYADNNQYPTHDGTLAGDTGIGCISQALLNKDSDCDGDADGIDQYLKVMPSDPKSAEGYVFCYKSIGDTRQDFVLCSVTELGDSTTFLSTSVATPCTPKVATSGKTGVFCLTSPF